MNKQLGTKKLTVIVPVCERTENAASLYYEYKEICSELCDNTELVYIVTTDHPQLIQELRAIASKDCQLTMIVLNRNYGEATAVQVGSSQATGDYILTLPPYKQVENGELVKLFDNLADYDIALGKRWPRYDSKANQLQTRIFNRLLSWFSGLSFSDIGCGIRLIKPHVLKETEMYGDQWRFFPAACFSTGLSLSRSGTQTSS